jgi:hypothetical protein
VSCALETSAGPIDERRQVASISGGTIWRWLDADAIRPWFCRAWMFPRDPDGARKAGRLFDLCAPQGRVRMVVA